MDELLGRGLGTAAAWRLGVTDDQARAAGAAVAHGRPLDPHRRTLGIAALAAGESARAARELADGAQGRGAATPSCRCSRRSRAVARVSDCAAVEPADPAALDAWRWLALHCSGTAEGEP